VPTRGSGRPGEVALDVEEDGAGDVPFEVGAASGLRVGEVPAAVDEAVAEWAQRPGSRRSARVLTILLSDHERGCDSDERQHGRYGRPHALKCKRVVERRLPT
jgi:hypothetical protein